MPVCRVYSIPSCCRFLRAKRGSARFKRLKTQRLLHFVRSDGSFDRGRSRKPRPVGGELHFLHGHQY